jgi:hypothetical protein
MLKTHMHSHVHCNTVYVVQEMETKEASINWWMNKENVAHTNSYKGIEFCYFYNINGTRDYCF